MPAVFPDGDLDDAAELGAIDSRSVRLWVRQTGTAAIEAELTVQGQPAVRGSMALSAESDWTGSLTLCLPAPLPGAAFTCKVGTHTLSGRLAPAPSHHTGVVFGFGSCNRPFIVSADNQIVKSTAAGLYPAMGRDLQQHRADFLLLAGDQVYSDELPPISVRDGLSGDAQHPPPFEEVLAAYRRVARGFLGETGFRRLREQLPSYWIWDDHDIFDSWGSRRSKSPLDWRMFEAASRTYGEYQHTRNPGGAIEPPPYNYTFRYGDVGFLVLDLRGARDYERGQLLGHEQWQEIRAYLAGKDAASIQTLFVVSSIPIAHVSRWMAKLFDRIPGNNGNAVRDRWCSAAFVDSRDALLGKLFAWQRAARQRQVIILSGDVHCASTFTIRPRRGTGLIRQFTSSAMTTPDPWSQRTVNRLAVKWPNLFEPAFAFRGRLQTFRNNFGLVNVEPLSSGGHRVIFSVRAWNPHQRRLGTAGRVIAVPGMS